MKCSKRKGLGRFVKNKASWFCLYVFAADCHHDTHIQPNPLSHISLTLAHTYPTFRNCGTTTQASSNGASLTRSKTNDSPNIEPEQPGVEMIEIPFSSKRRSVDLWLYHPRTNCNAATAIRRRVNGRETAG